VSQEGENRLDPGGQAGVFVLWLFDFTDDFGRPIFKGKGMSWSFRGRIAEWEQIARPAFVQRGRVFCGDGGEDIFQN
jgi:hypothetical protein